MEYDQLPTFVIDPVKLRAKFIGIYTNAMPKRLSWVTDTKFLAPSCDVTLDTVHEHYSCSLFACFSWEAFPENVWLLRALEMRTC